MENCSTRIVPPRVRRSVTPSKVSNTCVRLAVICADGISLTIVWSPGAMSGAAGQLASVDGVADGCAVGTVAVAVGVAVGAVPVGVADGDGLGDALGLSDGDALGE